ncbi:MAG TPA: Mur ligase family protein [Streptosporangiaceae bacterium]|nr:Mur ligase family protein [Streptosporangiaceae bacterium]
MTPDVRAELAAIEREIFARRPEHSIDPSLDRIIALTSLLGDPQRSYPVIHITGTNGKTSTARMTETLLRVRGLRTGLFTSPHLTSIRERISIDGEPLAAERFIEIYREIEPYLKLVDTGQANTGQANTGQANTGRPVRLSFFEVLTGMAFAAFADAPVDVAVIEVGMGGTWDNTNVADGVVAIATPISIDHAQYLGNTVEAIAADKAGIIKPGAIAVLAQQPVGAAAELIRRAVRVGASVAREGIEFGVLSRELAIGGQQLAIKGLLGEYHDLFLPLFGAYQAANASCALAAVEAFSGAAGSPGASPAEPDGRVGAEADDDDEADAVPADVVRADLGPVAREPGGLDAGLVRTAFAMMTSPGRFEIVRRSPVVLVDSAHNPAGMAATAATLTESFGPAEVIAVVAVSADKDVAGILDELEPVAAGIVATTNSSPRALGAAELAEIAMPVFGPDRVHVAERLDDAIEVAVGLADEASAAIGGPLAGLAGLAGPGAEGPEAAAGTVVLITGSVITAGDARLLLTGGGE